MNMDLFLGEKRWELLQIVADKPSAPLEIAEKLFTTVSYVSQQLKLLEVAGFVTKTRTGASLKGQARNVYSITNELVQLTVLTKEVAEKKLLHLTSHHKAILNIWMLSDSTLHFPIEKLFWKMNEDLGKIEGVFIDNESFPKVLIVSGSKEVKQKIDSYVKTFDRKIEYSFLEKNTLSKVNLSTLLILHDPTNILTELKSNSKKE